MTPTEAAIPHHSEIDPRYTWNAASVFPIGGGLGSRI